MNRSRTSVWKIALVVLASSTGCSKSSETPDSGPAHDAEEAAETGPRDTGPLDAAAADAPAPDAYADAGLDASADATPDATSDGGAPFGPIPLARLNIALSDAVCAFEVRCGLMPDGPTCRAIFDPATTDLAQLEAYVSATKLVYDEDKAGDCLTAYRDGSCAWKGGELGSVPVCRDVFSGTQAPDAPCFVDEECAGDSVCETQPCAGGCCMGTCRAKATPVPVGLSCGTAPCVGGAYCRLDGAGGAICTRTATAGAVCTSVDGCDGDSVCDLDPATARGRCVRLANAGEACSPGVAVGSCAGIDQWCEPVSSTCQPRKAIGASCSGEGQCIAAAVCSGGTCRSRPSVGSACGAAATGGGCLGDLPCVNGVCSRIQAEGVCR